MLNQDSPELEALFDSMVATRDNARETVPEAQATSEEMFNAIGKLTRNLLDTLREMGYDKKLDRMVHTDIPEARDRLNYVANLSQQAAERTLNAAESVQDIAGLLGEQAGNLAVRWGDLFDNRLSVDQFKELAHVTRAHLDAHAAQSAKVSADLIEIIIAQGSQDLTGQVIKKLLEMARQMECELVHLLLLATPPDKQVAFTDPLLAGPAVRPGVGGATISSQAQVDDLLESLGF